LLPVPGAAGCYLVSMATGSLLYSWSGQFNNLVQ